MNVICDIDGVVYRGDRLVAGSDEALRRLLDAGFDLWFATNNSTKTPEMISDRITTMTGVEVKPESIVTSSEAAVGMLEPGERPVMVLGSHGLIGALVSAGIEMTDDPKKTRALLVGLDFDLSYDRLTRAADAVRGGARFIASNTDPTYPIGEGLLPGGGSIVAAVQTTTGVSPEVAGKPHPPMRALLRSRGIGEAWVIGDQPATDIALAVAEPDWHSILVLSGVTRDGDTAGADHVVPDLAAAADLALRQV
jgi:4-nitrophenyl phosphatase